MAVPTSRDTVSPDPPMTSTLATWHLGITMRDCRTRRRPFLILAAVFNGKEVGGVHVHCSQRPDRRIEEAADVLRDPPAVGASARQPWEPPLAAETLDLR